MFYSMLLPLMVTSVGTYLLVKLRAFFILHPIRTMKTIVRGAASRERRRSLMLALAGTLGVGNIFGVAAGILLGGAGCVFWLLVSSAFCMIIKYSEVVLASDNACLEGGGMHRVFTSVFSRFGKGISLFYAALCLLLSLFMGASIQSAAVSETLSSSLGLSGGTSSFILIVLLLLPLVFGREKIQNITEYAIPLTTIVYILMTVSTIFANIQNLPAVVVEIFLSAFSPRGLASGGVFFISIPALYEGYARGILSNEAGVGTSAMAHSESAADSPYAAGVFGICEVFFDTVLLCTLTALTILVSVDDLSAYSSPMGLLYAAFTSSLGELSGIVLLFCIFVFAYATIICWYYYGSVYSEYLFSELSRPLFTLAFFGFIVIGGAASQVLIKVTDFILLLMSFPTLFAIIKESKKIFDLTNINSK